MWNIIWVIAIYGALSKWSRLRIEFTCVFFFNCLKGLMLNLISFIYFNIFNSKVLLMVFRCCLSWFTLKWRLIDITLRFESGCWLSSNWTWNSYSVFIDYILLIYRIFLFVDILFIIICLRFLAKFRIIIWNRAFWFVFKVHFLIFT